MWLWPTSFSSLLKFFEKWRVGIFTDPDGDLVVVWGVEGDAVEAVGHGVASEVLGEAFGAAGFQVEGDGMDG